MKRILITGANGQLGQSIAEMSKNHKEIECFFVTRNELDITNEDLVNHYFDDKSFDFVINCAAYTAVDKAEDDQENAFLVNAKLAPLQRMGFLIPAAPAPEATKEANSSCCSLLKVVELCSSAIPTVQTNKSEGNSD